MHHDQMRQLEQVLPAMPGFQIHIRICTQQQAQWLLRPQLLTQTQQGVHGIARRIALDFARIHHKGWIAGTGQTHHIQSRSRTHLRRAAMRRAAGRDKADVLQLQAGQCFLRQAQVTEVDGVEGAAENADCVQNLSSHMPFTEHDEFLRCQAFQSHRATRVDLVGGDADFRAQAIFETIGEAC